MEISPKQQPITLALPVDSLKEKRSSSILSRRRSTSLPSKPTASSSFLDFRESWRGSFSFTPSPIKDSGTDRNTKLLQVHTSDLQLDDDERTSTRYSPSVYTFGMGSINDGPDTEEPGGKSKDRNEMKELPLFNILPARSSDRSIETQKNLNSLDDTVNEQPENQSTEELDQTFPLVHVRRNPSRYGIFLRRSFVEAVLPISVSPELPPVLKLEDERLSVQCKGLDGSNKRRTRKSFLTDSLPDSPVPPVPAHMSLPSSANPLRGSRTSFPWPILNYENPIASSSNTNLHNVLPPLPTADDKIWKRNSRPRGASTGGETGTGTGHIASQDRTFEQGGHNRYTNSEKGKHVLGLASNDGAYDLRSRLERNKDAQGIIRSSVRTGQETPVCVVWLSLLNKPIARRGQAEAQDKMLRIDIPNDLVVSSMTRHGKKGRKYRGQLDFDDEYFALCLQAGYIDLLGNWFTRTLGPRKLKSIQVGRTNKWSGCKWQGTNGTMSRLLAAGSGFHSPGESRSPFTESALFRLYQEPSSGKARYTWVHWARRLAASNVMEQDGYARHDYLSAHPSARPSRRILSSQLHDLTPIVDAYAGLPSPSGVSRRLDTITTIQLVCELSAFRVLCALIIILTLSVFAAVLWIFVGATQAGGLGSSERASSRVASGMAIAVLVLLLESVGFVAWVWLS